MIFENGIVGSEFWVKSYNLSFSEIQTKSNVRSNWRDYLYVRDFYSGKILHPVNMYVSHMYPKPDLLSIDGNDVTLRQRTHAEIWVEPKGKFLYALDKCHQRQFYPSKELFRNDGCFSASYRFYMPWFINKNTTLSIKNITNEFSPFVIQEKQFIFDAPKDESPIFNTEFINFSIKTTGSHMISDEYGIIDIASPMFDIIVTLEQDEIEKLKEEYGI